MVNDIVTGIAMKLNNAFGDEYKIYDSNVEQGLQEPCFFIKLLTVLHSSYLGKRHRRAYPFDVHFFPVDETDNAAMFDVGETLLSELEYIMLLNGDILRGREMSYQIIDGVLHFYATYGVVLNDTTTEEAMEDCDIEVKS